jgi:hypothetical protein
VCFVHNTSLSNSKLDVKSHKCVFVVYSSGKKEYKCDDPVKKKLLKSLDVTFKETKLYFVLSTMLPFKVVVTLLSDRVGREGEHGVSSNGIKDTMDVSLSTSLDSRAD